jgi:AcrR family transcriptional regulator
MTAGAPRAGEGARSARARATRRGSPARRRRAPEEKRARLLAAARSLFAERGYAGTTTARLARQAGVAEGTVFHHFPSKRALLAAVAADYGRGLAQHMFAQAAPPGSELDAEPILRRAFGYVREQGALSRLLALAPDPTEWHATREASRREIVSALEAAFADWRGRAGLRAYDPRICAELLFALVEAALTECYVRGDGSREEEYLREAVACVEGALRPRANTPTETRSPS